MVFSNIWIIRRQVELCLSSELQSVCVWCVTVTADVLCFSFYGVWASNSLQPRAPDVQTQGLLGVLTHGLMYSGGSLLYNRVCSKHKSFFYGKRAGIQTCVFIVYVWRVEAADWGTRHCCIMGLLCKSRWAVADSWIYGLWASSANTSRIRHESWGKSTWVRRWIYKFTVATIRQRLKGCWC